MLQLTRLQVQISRIDDLVSDGGRRLLERVSHVSLEISLGDADLLVNGQPVFALAGPAEQATVSIVRADALLVPGDLASSDAIAPEAIEELKSRFRCVERGHVTGLTLAARVWSASRFASRARWSKRSPSSRRSARRRRAWM